MGKTKILLVSLFIYDDDNDNIRINNVYELLKENNDVTLLTMNFNHRSKKFHDERKNKDYIKMISVPSYKTNLSLKRFFSHGVFAVKLYKYLFKIKDKPDVIYCLVPTASSGFICSLYCKKTKIPLAIDVIDLWPESFIVLTKFKFLAKIITYPWKFMANYAYRSADMLFAESFEYARVAQKYNKKTNAIPIYLGTDPLRHSLLIEKSNLKIEKPANEIWICYGGSLGFSYDFDVILNSFYELINAGYSNIKLIFIGDGIKAPYINDFINKYKIPAYITGFLSYSDFLKYLTFCDIALNSFLQNTKVVHSYKFNDYLSSGLAVLNNLKGETAEFIDKYNVGYNFNYENDLLKNKLEYLINNPEILNKMKKNAIYVSNNILAKNIIYKPMIDLLEVKNKIQ